MENIIRQCLFGSFIFIWFFFAQYQEGSADH